MRLRARKNVVLPQPDGPISAVTFWPRIVSDAALMAWNVP